MFSNLFQELDSQFVLKVTFGKIKDFFEILLDKVIDNFLRVFDLDTNLATHFTISPLMVDSNFRLIFGQLTFPEIVGFVTD